jgi:hypothetical protein
MQPACDAPTDRGTTLDPRPRTISSRRTAAQAATPHASRRSRALQLDVDRLPGDHLDRAFARRFRRRRVLALLALAAAEASAELAAERRSLDHRMRPISRSETSVRSCWPLRKDNSSVAIAVSFVQSIGARCRATTRSRTVPTILQATRSIVLIAVLSQRWARQPISS